MFDNFFLQNLLSLFLWVPWLERKFILLLKHIYFVGVKINTERDIFILAGAMLKVMFILKERVAMTGLKISKVL